MRRPRSTSYKLAVAGTTLAVLLAAILLLSNRRIFGFIGTRQGCVLAHGSLLLGPCNPWKSSLGWVWYDPFQEETLGWEPSYAFAPNRVVTIALWIPVAVTVLLTAGLWLVERYRFPFSHCQRCGYDLTGNVSGVCPECGSRCARRTAPRPSKSRGPPAPVESSSTPAETTTAKRDSSYSACRNKSPE